MQATFEDLYRRFYPSVRSRCRRILRAPTLADDVAQETFLRLLAHGPCLEETHALVIAAWLHRTSARLSLDVLAAERRRSPAESADLACARSSPEDVAAARAELARVRACSTEAEIDAVLLSRSDGLTQPEIAKVLGVGERTVRRRIAQFDARFVAAISRTRRGPALAAAIFLVLVTLFSARSCAAEPRGEASQSGASGGQR